MAFSRLRRLGTFSLLAGLGLMAQAALAGTLKNVSVTPADLTPGATTTYTFQYTLDADVNADEALLYVTFPNDFSVATGACDRIVSFTLSPGPTPGPAICRASYGSGNTVGFAVNTSIGGGDYVDPDTVVTVVVGGVTNPSVAGHYDFDNAVGTGITTTQMMDPIFPMVTVKDIAPKQTVTIGTPTAINGACGIANGNVIDVSRLPPTAELCATATATATDFGYAEDATKAYWGCKGVNGGADTAANACSATKGHLLMAGPGIGDGTVSCVPNPVVTGGSSVCTPTPAFGYSFDSWSGDCVGAVCAPNNVTGILYIDANFVAAQYPITAVVNPSTAGSVSCSSNPVTHGGNTTCTVSANSGYTFSSWSGACTGATCSLSNVTGPKSVTANFTAPSFNIAVNTSGSGTASCTPNPVSGGSNSTCTASPSAGNSFTGWSGDCVGSSCVLTSVNANKSVTANFAPATYSISGSASPTVGGSVSCSSSVTHGGNGSCSASANTGYVFASWNGCPSASGSSCNFTNVTSSRTVTANFTANSYTVTASANPVLAGSAACVSPVTHGGNSSCTAKATTGYKFSNWSGACAGSDCFITNVTGNSTAVANFLLIPTYNVSTSLAPIDSGKITCTKDIIEGGTGTCTAKANSGYRFVSWGGDCSGTATSCKLENVTGEKSVSAIFEEVSSFNITATMQKIDGSTKSISVFNGQNSLLYSGVQCSAANPVSKNTTVTCAPYGLNESFVDDGSFRGWGGDCTRIEGQNCIIENVTTDKHLTLSVGFLASNRARITPAGAGSIWCTKSFISELRLAEVNSSCKIEANPGYTFVSMTEQSSFGFYKLLVNFSKVANTPVVTCTDCNKSTLITDTSTTQSVSKTSELDAQGNTTQSTVAVTEGTDGATNTSIIVTGQTSDSVGPSNQLKVSGTNSTVTVGDSGSKVVFGSDGSSSTIELSAGGVSGTLGSSSEHGSTVFNAKSNNGTRTDIYDFESGGSDITFTKPVSIKLPVDRVNDVDTDLLTLAKIISSKLEYYGGKYNSEGKNFEQDRKSFKLRAKPAADNSFAFISASWSENVNSNLVMEGTEQNTVTQHTVTLADKSAVELKTVVGITDKIVTTTLKMSTGETASNKGVTGKLNAGFAAIKVDGGATNGSFSIADKQVSADDQRQITLAVNNGELNNIELNDANGKQTFFTSASGSAPAVTGFESSAESFSITLSYPATK